MLRLCMVLLLSMTVYVSGQEYDWLYPVPQGNNINRIQFTGSNYGFAVGDAGTIMATYDGGLTWDVQYEAITDNMYDVAVIDPLNAFAVGDNGQAIKTTNGGYNWQDMKLQGSNALNAVVFVDNKNGWIAGDAKSLYHTTDGGATWIKQLQSGGITGDIAGISFVDANDGWFVSQAGLVYHTTNAGTNWTLQKTLGVSSNRIRFYSSILGAAACDNGMVAITTNGGAAWTIVPTGVTGSINDLLFVSPTEIWGAVETGKLIHSTDAGTTWTTTTVNEYSSFFAITKNNSVLYASGEYGIMIKKDLPASTWSVVANPTDQSANWIAFTSTGTGFAVGQDGFIIKSSDKGKSWTAIDNKITKDSFYGVTVTDKNNSWLVGDEGVLLHTSDGGTTWVQQETGLTTSLVTISFVDNNNGWAAGDGGVIMHTTNGGSTWTRQTSNTSNYLLGIHFADANKGWCVGAGGIMMRTTNGGSTWTTTASVVSSNLYSVSMITSALGFAAGPSGVMLKTTDAGASWVKVNLGITSNLALVVGTSANNLYAVGDSGKVFYSNDGGAIWTTQYAATYYNLYGAAIMDSILFVCGDNSAILTNNLAGLTDVRESTALNHTGPASFTLDQNYPNPFNPSTTIQYEVKKSGLVDVKIYNETGKLIASPIHREESPGTHMFSFNAAGLSSGVYYYTMSLNGTMQTKKMVVVK